MRKFRKLCAVFAAAAVATAVFPWNTSVYAADVNERFVTIETDNVINTSTKLLFGTGGDWQIASLVNNYAGYGGTGMNKSFTYGISDYSYPLSRMAGSSANMFQWKKAIGELSEREAHVVWENVGSYVQRAGVAEWIKTIRDVNPQCMFTYTVNIYNDTPENAADLVRFLQLEPDDPNAVGSDGINWAQKRVDVGIVDPVKVGVWELGNELDYPGWGWTKEKYVEEAPKYIEAIRLVDPNAKFAAQLAWRAPTHTDGQAWNSLIYDHLLDDVDYLAFHTYPWNIYTESTTREHIRLIENDERVKASGVGLYVSEHGISGDTQMKEADNGFGMISMRAAATNGAFYNTALNDPFVRLASLHGAGAQVDSTGWTIGYVDTDKTVQFTLPGEVLKLYADNAVGDVAKTTVEDYELKIGNTVIGTGTKRKISEDNLSASAVKTDDGLNIFLVNPTDREFTVRFAIDNPVSVKYQTVIAGDGSAAMNNTGRHDVDIKRVEVDSGTALESYTIPQYSVILLETGYTDDTQTIRRKTVNSNSRFDSMAGETSETDGQRVTANSWKNTDEGKADAVYDESVRSYVGKTRLLSSGAGLYQDIPVSALQTAGSEKYRLSSAIKPERGSGAALPQKFTQSLSVRYAHVDEEGNKVFSDEETPITATESAVSGWNSWQTMDEEFEMNPDTFTAIIRDGRTYEPYVRMQIGCDTLTSPLTVCVDNFLLERIYEPGDTTRVLNVQNEIKPKRYASSDKYTINNDSDFQNVGYSIGYIQEMNDTKADGKWYYHAYNNAGASVVNYDMESGSSATSNKALKIDLKYKEVFAIQAYPKDFLKQTGSGWYCLRADVKIPANANKTDISSDRNNAGGEPNRVYYSLAAQYRSSDNAVKRVALVDARFAVSEFDKVYHISKEFTLDADSMDTYTDENGKKYDLEKVEIRLGQYEFGVNLGIESDNDFKNDTGNHTALMLDNMGLDFFGFDYVKEDIVQTTVSNYTNEDAPVHLFYSVKENDRLINSGDLAHYTAKSGFPRRFECSAPQVTDGELVDIFAWSDSVSVNGGYPCLKWEMERSADSKSDVWDGSVDTSWYDADGTEFEINTAAQLAGLAQLVRGGNTFNGKTVKLNTDIDLNGDFANGGADGKSWAGIGNGTKVFGGIFNGQGHIISNIKTNINAVALFGRVEGTVENLGVEDFVYNVPGNWVITGGIASYLGNTDVGGTIRNCYVKNFKTVETSGNNYTVGGIVKQMCAGSKIENCYVSKLSLNGSGSVYCGGICYDVSNPGDGISIKNCYINGVDATGAPKLKPYIIAQMNNALRGSLVENCFAAGYSVTATDSNYTGQTYLKNAEELKDKLTALGSAFDIVDEAEAMNPLGEKITYIKNQ